MFQKCRWEHIFDILQPHLLPTYLAWLWFWSINIGYRAVGRSENPGVPALLGGHNLPPLVEIGLTYLPKSGGAPTSQGTTPLRYTKLGLKVTRFKENVYKLFWNSRMTKTAKFIFSRSLYCVKNWLDFKNPFVFSDLHYSISTNIKMSFIPDHF